MTDVPQSRSEQPAGTVEVLAVEWSAGLSGNPHFTLTSAQPRGYQTGTRLAPHLPALLAHLTSFIDDFDLFYKRRDNFGRVSNSLGGMCYAFYEYVRIQSALVETSKLKPGVTYVLSPDTTEPLAYMLDMFLDHTQRYRIICITI